jgi:hypothetical protein
MSIYQDILNWSQGRPAFVQDALRRLVASTTLTQNDIDELVQLVKKECGDNTITINPIPLNSTHIPTTIAISGNYPKLISLNNPINICALHNQGRVTIFQYRFDNSLWWKWFGKIKLLTYFEKNFAGAEIQVLH